MRTYPTSDVTLHVAPTGISAGGYWPDTPHAAVTVAGNDTTGDGSRSAPFATPQKAHDVLAATYDLQGEYRATIQLAIANSGTFFYPGIGISGRLVGQGGCTPPLLYGNPVQSLPIGKYRPYTLRGDPANMTGVMLWPGHLGFPVRPALSLSDGAALKIEGFIVATDGINQDCIDVFGSFLDIGNIWFGPAGNNNFLHIGAAWGSTIMPTGPLMVTGGGVAFMQVDDSEVLPNVDGGSPVVPITFMNNPAFQQAVFWIDGGKVYANKMAFAGTVNARKCTVLRGGRLETGGNVNIIPGTFAATDIEDKSILR